MKKDVVTIALLILIFSSCSSEIENNDPIVDQSSQPLKVVKSLEELINQIKEDTAWFQLIEVKAKQRNASIEEILLEDAKYMESIETEIVKIENDIIKDSNWFKLIEEKAKEQNRAIDDVLREDASYIYQTNNSK